MDGYRRPSCMCFLFHFLYHMGLPIPGGEAEITASHDVIGRSVSVLHARRRHQAMGAKGKQQAQGPPPRPQFFRILLPGFSQRLTIPQPFNKYIVAEIQKTATIVSPLGKPWPVEVQRATSFFYFGEGWQEFSQAHELNVGCFIVFTYEGEMVFTVTIFDQNTCMKEYGLAGTGNKMDCNSYSSVDVKASEPQRQHSYLHEQPEQSLRLRSTDSQNHDVDLASAGTEETRFEIKIASYNPCEEPSLPLPQEFSKCLREGNSTLATICCPLSKPWRVEVHKDNKGSFHFADGWPRFAGAHDLKRGDTLVFKHSGALNFDVAIFDNSIGEPESPLDVASGVANGRIPTAEKDSNEGHEKPLCGMRFIEATEPSTGQHGLVKTEELVAPHHHAEAPDLVMSGSAKMLHFEVVINFSLHYRRYMFEIPGKFAASNGLSSRKQLFLRDPNGQMWPVRISHRSSGRQRSTIYAGWNNFCIGNNLQDGDVCMFELKGKNVLHVQIRRRRHLKSVRERDTSRKLKRSLRGCTAAQSGTNRRAGRSTRMSQDQKLSELVGTCTKRVQFTCTIFRSNLDNGSLNIPRSFLSSVDLSSVRQLALLDTKGRRWPVNVYHWQSQGRHQVQIGSGWKAFCICNNVKLGDQCTFKLASRVKNDVLFHVSIIKQKPAARLGMAAK